MTLFANSLVAVEVIPGFWSNCRVVRVIDLEGVPHAIVATREAISGEDGPVYRILNEKQLRKPLPKQGSDGNFALVSDPVVSHR